MKAIILMKLYSLLPARTPTRPWGVLASGGEWWGVVGSVRGVPPTPNTLPHTARPAHIRPATVGYKYSRQTDSTGVVAEAILASERHPTKHSAGGCDGKQRDVQLTPHSRPIHASIREGVLAHSALPTFRSPGVLPAELGEEDAASPQRAVVGAACICSGTAGPYARSYASAYASPTALTLPVGPLSGTH